MDYNLMALTLAPAWAVLVTGYGLVAWSVTRHIGDKRTRALVVAAVARVGMGLAAALLFLVWGRDWWTYTVPETAGIVVMGVLPLLATGYAVWSSPKTSAWQILLISAGSVAVGIVVFATLGVVVGAPVG